MLSKYKLAIGIVIVIGLVLILMLPKYRAHQLLTQARTAAERGKEIAFLLDMYKNKYHRFAPDFAPLELSFDCERKAQNTQLVCDNYNYHMENGSILRVQHATLPQWFEIDVENGTIICNYEKDFLAGAQLCEQVYVPTSL